MLHLRKYFKAKYCKCIDLVFNQRDNVFPRQLVIRQSFPLEIKYSLQPSFNLHFLYFQEFH